MSRAELDRVLVDQEEFDPSNTLRAVKSLARAGLVIFRDAHHKSDAVAALPQFAKRVSDEEIGELLKEIGGAE